MGQRLGGFGERRLRYPLTRPLSEEGAWSGLANRAIAVAGLASATAKQDLSSRRSSSFDLPAGKCLNRDAAPKGGRVQVQMSGLVRFFVVSLWVSAVALTWVPAVEASTVSLTVEEGVDATLTYQAAPGEMNRVGVTFIPPGVGWIVTEKGFDGPSSQDALTLTAGQGCTSLTPQIALCEHNLEDVSETPLHVVLRLGDSPAIPFIDTADRAWASDACGDPDPFGCETRISGGPGVDVVFASDAGGASGSEVRGGSGGDILRAGELGSRLIGGGGDDILIGGSGRDRIGGGRGGDTIRGGLRTDELRGGVGRDTFYARDPYRDRVFGGAGRDRARVDRRVDRVRSIERFF